jgi:hypothetical protein
VSPTPSAEQVTDAVRHAMAVAENHTDSGLTSLELGFVTTALELSFAVDHLRAIAPTATPDTVTEYADQLDALLQRLLDVGEAMTGTRPEPDRVR